MPQYTPHPARPVLAAEINDATQSIQPGDSKQSPRYALLPSGLDANRVRFSGTLTEVTDVGNGGSYYRGRIVGPTGTVFVYAGDNHTGPMSFLMDAQPPEYVTVKGKIATFEDGRGNLRVKINPETMAAVPAHERHRTIAEAATNLVSRLKRLVEESDTSGRFYPDVYLDAYGEDHFQGLDYLGDAIDALEDVDGAVGHETADPAADNTPTSQQA